MKNQVLQQSACVCRLKFEAMILSRPDLTLNS